LDPLRFAYGGGDDAAVLSGVGFQRPNPRPEPIRAVQNVAESEGLLDEVDYIQTLKQS
jgi:hypothetical protein